MCNRINGDTIFGVDKLLSFIYCEESENCTINERKVWCVTPCKRLTRSAYYVLIVKTKTLQIRMAIVINMNRHNKCYTSTSNFTLPPTSYYAY